MELNSETEYTEQCILIKFRKEAMMILSLGIIFYFLSYEIK